MKKTIFVIVLFCFNLYICQNNNLINVKYKLTYLKDSLDVNSKREDIMSLSIDSDSSFYYSQTRFEGDSLFEIDKKKLSIDQLMLNKDKYNTKSSSILVLNDKKNNSIQTSNKILNNIYMFSENISIPNWKLTNESQKYLDYTVYKATGKFYGRDYIAWFTTQIPISQGPYKFYGLPGLILKITDTKNNFNFECVEIKKRKDFHFFKKLYSSRKPLNMSRTKYFQIEEESVKNFMNFVSHNSEVIIQPVNGTVKKQDFPYNPIELIK